MIIMERLINMLFNLRPVDILSLFMFPIILLFYTIFTVLLLKRIKLRQNKRRIYNGIITVLNNSSKIDQSIKQLLLLFKIFSEKNLIISKQVDSVGELLEEIIYDFDTKGENIFKILFKIEMNIEIRNRIINIYNKFKEKNPFSSINPKEATLLQNLKNSIENNNKELGLTILNQISEEI